MVAPVTVLMAVWNTPPALLEGAIDSILGQGYREFEFLIVNDGSEDPQVLACLKRYAARDSRVRVTWEPHRGLTPSLNRGLALARGRFIARQDADDWSDPSRLEKQFAFFSSYPAALLCGSNARIHQQNGHPLWATHLPERHEDILAAFPRGNPFVHGAVMFRRDAAETAGGYREALECSQDYDLFWRLAEMGGAANLPEALYHYRFAGCSVSASRATSQEIAHRAARLLAEARRRGAREDIGAALDQAMRSMHLDGGSLRARLKQADHLMLAGEYAHAANAYLRLASEGSGSLFAIAKLIRLIVFCAAPRLRESCFR